MSSARMDLPECIAATRLIAVMRRLGSDRVARIAPMLRDAGVSVFEVTLDGEEALTSIHWLADNGYDVGAGTVLTVEQAGAAHAAGAQFLVSPGYDPHVVDSAAQSIPFIPGGLTPSEVGAAWASGACAVKLFPASMGGPAYVRAMRGPLSHIPLIPTGGIAADNAAEFLDAGAVAVGVGGWLTNHADDGVVVGRAAELVASVAAYR